MRSIGIITFSRSDYSSCLPVIRAIECDEALSLYLVVSGMHLVAEFGHTVRDIEKDGFEIHERIDMGLSADTAEAIAESIGVGTIGFSRSFGEFKPDIMVMVGDRYELLAAACAALPFKIPIAHISGGDETEGAIDNQVRHAITKMSHIHFVSMQAHADRLVQMGEEAQRIFVTGDPALDEIRQMKFLRREELGESLGLPLRPPVVMVTLHPTTLSALNPENEVNALCKALDKMEGTLIISSPNADVGNRVIADRLRVFADRRHNAVFVANLGQLRYYSLMAIADVMVGNSSSGIWEAPSFALPVVNIGARQNGRLKAKNVVDANVDSAAIHQAISTALDPAFRRCLAGLENPYGDGRAASRITQVLKTIEYGPEILIKRFVDRAC